MLALAAAVLGGCSTMSHPLHPTYAYTAYPLQSQGSGSTSALVYSPGLERSAANPYLGAYAPEFSRNDHTMSIQDRSRRDELFGLPPERRASLGHRRVFRGARNAEDYAYPAESRRGYRGYHRYRRD